MLPMQTSEIPHYKEWEEFQKYHIESENVREIILQSWREAKALGLNGFDEPRTIVLDEEQMAPILKRSTHLIEIVRKHITNYYERVDQDIDYSIMLYNDQGVLLSHFHGPKGNILPFHDLIPGLLCGFPFYGHTALSLALKTGKMQYMSGAEHFFSIFHPFSSVAVPIFHPINRTCIGCLVAIRNEAHLNPALQGMVVALAMSIEEVMRMDYTEANIFKIHEEITNLIDYYILILGSDGRIVDCNRALYDLLPNSKIIGKTAKEFIEEHFDYDFQDSLLYRSIFYAEEATNVEIWAKIHGRKYCFLVDLKIIYDPYDPNFYWIIEVFKDITQKKEMDQHWIQREKMVSLGTLAAGLAHEIRNPLTTAKGFIQLMSQNSPDKEKYYLIQNELERITQLVNQFVLLSKPDSPQMKLFKAHELIDEFAQFIQPEALLKGIEINVYQYDQESYIRADKNQLTQVFLNLSQNAFQAMESGGILLIECERAEDDFLEIRFIDNGIGISEENLAKILDPFFSTKEEGTGLGLPICYQIIHAHHGDLKILSDEGKGTKAIIRLPIQKTI